MTKRNYEIDLFRIIAAVFVVALHVLGQGGILKSAVAGSAVFWSAWLVEIIAYCAVNCFALITGYVMVSRKIKAKSIIGLWLQLLFYSAVISSVFFITAPETVTVKNIISIFFPVLCKTWWYVSSYFVVFFTIPLLNAAIDNIDISTYRKLLFGCAVSVGILDCVIKFVIDTDAFVFNRGYSPIWLTVLYLFGAYIKKYNVKERFSAKKSILCFLGAIAFTFLSKVVIYYAYAGNFPERDHSNTFVSYTSITILLASVFLCLFCLNLKVGRISQRVIGIFAPTAFGVYLIHVHPLVFFGPLTDAFAAFADKQAPLTVLLTLMAVLAIFLVCSALEWLRILLFRLMRTDRLCELADSKIAQLSDKIFNK